MRAVQAPTPVALKNILFLTDFSKPSEAALPFATAITRNYEGTIHVLHVLTPVIPDSCPGATTADEELAKVEMQEVESQLAGVAYETTMESGMDVWLAIEQAIKEHHIDLIVLGTHGRTGAQKFLLGSVAEEVFRRSPVPVLTIGPHVHVRGSVHNGAQFHHVLFATDFTPESLTAAPYASSLAQENQAQLMLLHVIRNHELRKHPTLGESSLANVRFNLNELVREGVGLYGPAKAVVQYGQPADRIVEAAKERGSDLIVLGVRTAAGHLGAATHLNRATAYEVVAHAPCPVVTVRG
jgi:nucleotide-binding universal stress UspA family protein